jgi:MoxR-like ATPase
MQEEIKDVAQKVKCLQENISEFFIGKNEQINQMLIGFFSGLHVLIEDVPGVGKTTLAKCLAASVGLDFSRIQFTPDLLPGDIIGMTIWSTEKKEFMFKQGSIIHQFILADEINRASPRTQSSLLEAMQDESVSVDGKTHKLPQPFFVIATQNPPYFLGTFHLPEVELDRFGLSFSLGYPVERESREILKLNPRVDPFISLKPVITPEEVIKIRGFVHAIHTSGTIDQYIVEIVNKSRISRLIKLGISVRAMQHLHLAAKAKALFTGRDFVIPEDIIEMAAPVLAHRIILSSEARLENKSAQEVIQNLINGVNIPA